MKKIIIALCVAVLVLGLAACGSPAQDGQPAETEAADPADTETEGGTQEAQTPAAESAESETAADRTPETSAPEQTESETEEIIPEYFVDGDSTSGMTVADVYGTWKVTEVRAMWNVQALSLEEAEALTGTELRISEGSFDSDTMDAPLDIDPDGNIYSAANYYTDYGVTAEELGFSEEDLVQECWFDLPGDGNERLGSHIILVDHDHALASHMGYFFALERQ